MMERYDIRVNVWGDVSGPQYEWETVRAEDGDVVLYADAQATVEALRRERDEAITAHRNIVKQFDELTCFIGCDYDPETETWVSGKPPYPSAGTNEVEACKAAVDALRSVAIVLQTALDAEREKVKGLHEATKVICGHCCESMDHEKYPTLSWQIVSTGSDDFSVAIADLLRYRRTLPATPTESGEDHSGDDTDMVS